VGRWVLRVELFVAASFFVEPFAGSSWVVDTLTCMEVVVVENVVASYKVF
jgi:hypothetical protein